MYASIIKKKNRLSIERKENFADFLTTNRKTDLFFYGLPQKHFVFFRNDNNGKDKRQNDKNDCLSVKILRIFTERQQRQRQKQKKRQTTTENSKGEYQATGTAKAKMTKERQRQCNGE